MHEYLLWIVEANLRRKHFEAVIASVQTHLNIINKGSRAVCDASPLTSSWITIFWWPSFIKLAYVLLILRSCVGFPSSTYPEETTCWESTINCYHDMLIVYKISVRDIVTIFLYLVNFCCCLWKCTAKWNALFY